MSSPADPSAPIGVMDSGVGGLTVLQVLRARLPCETFIYVGDLKHLPYGEKPQSQVRELTFRATDYLARAGVKLIVIACNTASAATFEDGLDMSGVRTLRVVGPTAKAAVAATSNQRIAVLSTVGTATSGQYEKAIKSVDPACDVLSMGAFELVGIVERGEADTRAARDTLHRYVGRAIDWGADTLVLGCTHYPVLRGQIDLSLAGHPMAIVDSGAATAADVVSVLDRRALRTPAEHAQVPRFLVTGDVARFTRIARDVFHEVDHAELVSFDEPVPTS